MWQTRKHGATKAAFSVATYKPFGVPVSPSGSEKFKYAGEIQDASTGLYYVGARFMDPELGRCLSPDHATLMLWMLWCRFTTSRAILRFFPFLPIAFPLTFGSTVTVAWMMFPRSSIVTLWTL